MMPAAALGGGDRVNNSESTSLMLLGGEVSLRMVGIPRCALVFQAISLGRREYCMWFSSVKTKGFLQCTLEADAITL